jgi:hypothetical protein
MYTPNKINYKCVRSSEAQQPITNKMTKEGSGDMASPADHALWAKIYKNRQNRMLEGHEEEVAA